MPDTVLGLPTHILMVHATVVVVPAAALLVALSAWPRFRAWAGVLPLVVSLAALVLVPLTTSSGEGLERHVPFTPLVEEHTHLADGLLPFVIVLVVAAAGLLWVHLQERPTWLPQRVSRSAIVRDGSPARVLVAAVLLVAAVGVVGTVVQVVRIGHSGAKAVWSHTATTQPAPRPGGDPDDH